MSKNPSDRQRMPEDQNKDMSKNVEKEQQQHHRQGEPLGQQKHDTMGRDKKKQHQTVQFDEGQKFTSDDDIKKRRTA
ncbi:MAG TPA: hypothetical protein VKY31_09055 [Terriglobia bacterium]|nr:hypothetical protein [Terriglobia bacterium]